MRGSGVNQTKAALYINNGYISFRTVIGKFLLSALAIGSGHSLGPEDPSLQIGAGVASLISRRMGLSRERLRLFAPIGAAAGLAAAFNAPISAILFVIEEVIGQWNAAVLGSIVLSAVSSVVVARSFWGSEPMFRIPTVTFDSRELLAYTVLGVFGGIAALHLLQGARLSPAAPAQAARVGADVAARPGRTAGRRHRLLRPARRSWARATEPSTRPCTPSSPGRCCCCWRIFKIIATTLSFSSGTPGGMFAPTLFIGAMLGAAIGAFEKLYFPQLHLTGSLGSYALVGMGVLFAAFLRAPLTSVFMVLEVSGNYSIIVPVILANTIAYVISRSFQPVPVFEMLTHQDGLYLPSMEEQREESELHIEDAMQPVVVPILQGSTTLADAIRLVSEHSGLEPSSALLIHCSNGLWYAARYDELQAIFARTGETDPTSPLEAHLGPDRTPVLFPDLPLSSTLPYFNRWPLLPITNRAMRGALEGTLSQSDVLKRYQRR